MKLVRAVTMTWTSIGYWLLPIGLLLIFMVEPGRVFTYRRKNGPRGETATVITATIWWCAFCLQLNSGSSRTTRLELLLGVCFVGVVLHGCVVLLWDMHRRSTSLQPSSRGRRTDAAALVLPLFGSLNALGHSASSYRGLRSNGTETYVRIG